MPHFARWNVRQLAWTMVGSCLVLGIASAAADPPVHPHPVLAWPAGPFEVRVAFDRPIDAAVTRSLTGRLIPFEEEVSIVRQAKKTRPGRIEAAAAHRGTLRIAAARLVDGDRTLALVTDPHPRVATYSLHLNRIRVPGLPEPGESIDLLYGLGGVEVSWDDGREGSKSEWSGWWPDLDPGIVRQLTRGSIEHEQSLTLMSRPGKIVFNTLFALPKGPHTLRLVSSGAIDAVVAGVKAETVEQPGGGEKVEHRIDSSGEPIDLTVTLPTGVTSKPTTFRASYFKDENPKDVRLSHERLLVPWATTTPPLPIHPPLIPNELTGGDPARGASIFFGEQARCSACHAMGGKGGTVGPDLAHQFERPAGEVYRDLADPGAWINPDYAAYTVALKDGRVLVGIVRAQGADSVRITDADAKSMVVRRDEIEDFRPSSTSIMPVGLAGTLGEGSLRDLLSYLTRPPSSP